jgi:hypothetical protein
LDIFCFDERALHRRTDHDLLGQGHELFMGPSDLRRYRGSDPSALADAAANGTVVTNPVLIDIEIFDAFFG